MNNLKFHITEDDYRLLQFLWRWKLSTTAIIHKAIYKDRSVNCCYRRLHKLEKQKYIESTLSRDGALCLWHLTDKGYFTLDFSGIEISQSGFRSEHPEHDFWVTLIHQGLWLDKIPENAALFSEQQLRRFEVESYPNWVPHTKRHRPDGWWKTNLNQSNKESLISLEVELNRKPAELYKDVGYFYSSVIDLNQVIWFVKSDSDAGFIHRSLLNGSSSNCEEQSFVLLSHFIQYQWQAKVLLGKNAGIEIHKILNASKNIPISSMTYECLLEKRKSPINTSKKHFIKSPNLGLSKNIYGN